MKILFNGMVGTNHSWSFVSQELARSMKNLGHQVNIKSTNGLQYFPEDLRENLLIGNHSPSSQKIIDYVNENKEIFKLDIKDLPQPVKDPNIPYDIEICYTIPFQFPRRFNPYNKCKMAIWNFESSILPAGWHLYTKAIDYLLPSSKFSYDIFANNGIPKEKMVIVPHGIDAEKFNPSIPPYSLKTNKKIKFLSCARPHARKFHDRIIKGYLDAFTADDDVCLVLKTEFIKPNKNKVFEVDVREILEKEYKGRSKPAEIEVITDYIPFVGSLYTACDVVVSMSSTEGFCLLPNTIIDNPFGCPKSIKDIKKGDFVISHKGNFCRVNGTERRWINENIVEIKRLGSNQPFCGTSEHPHFAIKRIYKTYSHMRKYIQNGALKPEWIKLGNLEKGDLIAIPKIKKHNIRTNMVNLNLCDYPFKSNGEYMWLKGSFRKTGGLSITQIANEVGCCFQQVSDVLLNPIINSPTSKKIKYVAEKLNYIKPEPIKIKKSLPLNKELAEFLGLYVAEGSIISKNNVINFSSHKTECWARQIQKYVGEKIFNIPTKESIYKNTGRVDMCSKILANKLIVWCGKGSKNKKIPKFIFNSNFAGDFIRGLFYGDGSVRKNQYRYGSSSLNLVQDLFKLLLSYNIFSYINLSKTRKNEYELCVARIHNERFFNLVNPVKYNKEIYCKNSYKNNSIIETDEYFFVPIKNVVKKMYEGEVYNLHIDKDESFTSWGMATHNCLPNLEALACGNLVIAPRYGGQLEYLNDGNALLINTKEMKAPPSHQYWVQNSEAIVGDPDIEHFKELLRYTYENLNKEKERVKETSKKTIEKYTWNNMAKIILDLPIPKINSRYKDKMKVLFIVPYSIVGGAEIWMLENLKLLDRSKYEPEICFISGTTLEFENEIKLHNLKYYDLSNQGGIEGFRCLAEAGNYDIIHFYNSFAVYNTLKDLWKFGLRCVIIETIHSLLKWNDSMSKVSKRENFVSKILVLNNYTKEYLENYKNTNVEIIPQMINWEKFYPNRNKEILKQHNINPNLPTIGFVGRISAEKNINVIISCAERLPDCNFLIVGEGNKLNDLKNMSKNLNNVYFLGNQKNTELYYNAFDVLMLPSLIEGFPLVLLEAMSCGTPIIASNVGGIGEVIKDKYGILIQDPNNVEGFLEGINYILNKSNWNELSKNGLLFCKKNKEACERLNLNQIYNQYLRKN